VLFEFLFGDGLFCGRDDRVFVSSMILEILLVWTITLLLWQADHLSGEGLELLVSVEAR
jgi:hypothetical protein